jgi:acetyl-CoA acetyltransferase
MTDIERQKAFRNKTAVVGIGYSRSPFAPGGFSKSSGESVLTLAVRAAREAAADAGIDPRQLDGAVMYGLNDSVAPGQVLGALGCPTINYASGLSGGGNYPSFAIMQAAEAVNHGICDYVLVYRAMNGRSGVRMGQLNFASAAAGDPNRIAGPGQFTAIYGLAGPPSQYAFNARRYMDLYGVTSEDFGRWAVNSRSNAVKYPRATMRSPITLEDHQNSRMIVDPYHLLDCCLETDVACTMIVTTAERARDMKKRPVYISAAIGGSSPLPDSVDTGLKVIGKPLLEAAGIELKDIDIFMPYDNFTDCPMRMVEDMGYCERGEAKDFIKDGRISLDGEIPMETQGGLMSEGYAHGLNNALEAVQQLRGEAEDLCPNWANGEHTYDRSVCRQVRDPQIAMRTGVEGSCAIIFQRG